MKYPEFNNIEISNYLGVSRVGKDTLALARFAVKVSGRSVLDVGTGTGFVAIYLSSLGKKVHASDISKTSIKAVAQNAKVNKVNLRLYESDLFKNISDTYDIITFNPPIATSSSAQTVVLIERLKSILPKSDLLFKFGFIFLGNQRRTLIKKFLRDAQDHLSKNGKIIMLVASGEEQLLKEYNHSFYVDGDIPVAVIKKAR